MKIWLFRVALLVPVLMVLALLEIGARLHAYYSDASLQRGLAELGQPAPGADFSLQHIIRWHANAKLIYELIPNLRGEFRGHRLTINANGFRGPMVSVPKPEGVYRIVGVGDSVMFGWGVADDEVYLARLHEQLSKRFAGRTFDWVNAAVPGYNMVNEVETLAQKLLPLQPDLVIVDHVRNDLHVPGFLRKPRPYFSLQQSFLAQWVRNLREGLHVPDNVLERPPDAFRRESFVGDEASIPEAYRDLIGLEAFRKAATRLRDLARREQFRVIVFAHYGLDPEPRAVLEALGLDIVDGFPRAQAYLREHGYDEYLGSPLTVSAKDSHPSALHHGLIAEHLAEALVGSGL